ncbi:MAG: transposase [Opitutaceae bacterium]|nr:transposase [Opitutaceae bacterium]
MASPGGRHIRAGHQRVRQTTARSQQWGAVAILEGGNRRHLLTRSLLTRRAQIKRQCRALIPQLLSLIHRLKTSGLDQAATLGRSLHQWREEIVRMWRFSRNNGITEGFHRKMKLIQRKAYGFRSFLNYRLRALAQCS